MVSVKVIECVQAFSPISTSLSFFFPYFSTSYLKGEKRMFTITYDLAGGFYLGF